MICVGIGNTFWVLLVVYICLKGKGAIYRYERMGNWCANKKVLTFGTQAVRLPPP